MVQTTQLIHVRFNQPAGYVISFVAILVSAVVGILAWRASAAAEATPEKAASEGAGRRHCDAASDLTLDFVKTVGEGTVDRDHDQRQPYTHRQHRDQ